MILFRLSGYESFPQSPSFMVPCSHHFPSVPALFHATVTSAKCSIYLRRCVISIRESTELSALPLCHARPPRSALARSTSCLGTHLFKKGDSYAFCETCNSRRPRRFTRGPNSCPRRCDTERPLLPRHPGRNRHSPQHRNPHRNRHLCRGRCHRR